MSYPPIEGSPVYYFDWTLLLMALAMFWYAAGIFTILILQKVWRIWDGRKH